VSALWDYSVEVAPVNRIAEEKQPQMNVDDADQNVF
jgi:hypothetical protein